jgi:hypothetical protein
MSTNTRRDAVLTICGSLIAALALAQTGCPLGDQGHAGEESRKANPSSRTSSARSPTKAAKEGRQSSGRGELKDPLLRSFGGALDEADEIEDSELREARKILREADPILRRAREENRRALERANRPPRIVKQRQPVTAKPEPAQAATGETEN